MLLSFLTFFFLQIQLNGNSDLKNCSCIYRGEHQRQTNIFCWSNLNKHFISVLEKCKIWNSNPKCFIFFRNYLKHGERHTPTFRVNIIFPTFNFHFFTKVVLHCFWTIFKREKKVSKMINNFSNEILINKQFFFRSQKNLLYRVLLISREQFAIFFWVLLITEEF